MKDLLRLKRINALKQVYRSSSVADRKESTAEHTWATLMVADYFFGKISAKLDRLKVYELLMYHDLVEIIAGDTVLHPTKEHKDKKEKEMKAALELKKDLPEPISTKFFELFKEFEEQKTKEAQFARTIDKFEAVLHELDYKERWKGWTKEFILKKKEFDMSRFPEVEKIFLEMLDYAEKEGYFWQ